jgi:hypothetical protein
MLCVGILQGIDETCGPGTAGRLGRRLWPSDFAMKHPHGSSVAPYIRVAWSITGQNSPYSDSEQGGRLVFSLRGLRFSAYGGAA